MNFSLDPYQAYFQDKLDRFGQTPRGLDWNSSAAQDVRFAQLTRVIRPPAEGDSFSLLDYGSGFGPYYAYLRDLGLAVRYTGYDFVPDMVRQGRERYAGEANCRFTDRLEELEQVDYCVASGIFNIRLERSAEEWQAYVLDILAQMNRLSRLGMAFNMLTSYSDAAYMKEHLYYADPCFYFDFCKRNFSRSVALLHDYWLYDFTILVRKDGSA